MSEENEGGLFSCPVISWIIGALLGLATYLILSGRFEMGTILSLIIGLVVMVATALLLARLFCSGMAASSAHSAPRDHEIAATPKAVAEVDAIGGGDLAMAPSVPEVAQETSSTAVAKAASLADVSVAKPKAAAKPKAVAKPKAAAVKPKVAAKPKAAAKSKAAAKPKASAAKPKAKAAAKPKAASTAAKKAATKTASKPARKPVAKDGKPEMLKKARAGGADDLKQIKGVGPKMEKMLNTMGVYHFDQVSGWRAKEVQWVDDNLEGFKGRVSRDEWVKQAKVLAKGGKTEFSKKVEKGGVYAKNKK